MFNNFSLRYYFNVCYGGWRKLFTPPSESKTFFNLLGGPVVVSMQPPGLHCGSVCMRGLPALKVSVDEFVLQILIKHYLLYITEQRIEYRVSGKLVFIL